MTRSFWQDEARASECTVDVAVVGGGVVGCATAYWLQQLAPKRRVAIVEARQLAAGATGRGEGFLLPGGFDDYLAPPHRYDAEQARRQWRFMKENLDIVSSQLGGSAIELEQRGSVTVLAPDEDAQSIHRAVSRMRSDGVPVAPLTADQTNERLCTEQLGEALYVPSGAVVNPVLLVRQLAEESGASVLEYHPVQQVRPESGSVVLETPRRRIRAGQIVLAMGTHLPRLYPALQRYVKPVRGQMLATLPTQQRRMSTPVFLRDRAYSVRQLPDGTLMIGQGFAAAPSNGSLIDETTPAVQADLERYLHRHFPQARGLSVCRRWSRLMAGSLDDRPVVGTIPDVPNSFWTAGFAGKELGCGVRFGRLMAEMLLGDSRPAGLDLFSSERFDPVPAT